MNIQQAKEHLSNFRNVNSSITTYNALQILQKRDDEEDWNNEAFIFNLISLCQNSDDKVLVSLAFVALTKCSATKNEKISQILLKFNVVYTFKKLVLNRVEKEDLLCILIILGNISRDCYDETNNDLILDILDYIDENYKVQDKFVEEFTNTLESSVCLRKSNKSQWIKVLNLMQNSLLKYHFNDEMKKNCLTLLLSLSKTEKGYYIFKYDLLSILPKLCEDKGNLQLIYLEILKELMNFVDHKHFDSQQISYQLMGFISPKFDLTSSKLAFVFTILQKLDLNTVICFLSDGNVQLNFYIDDDNLEIFVEFFQHLTSEDVLNFWGNEAANKFFDSTGLIEQLNYLLFDEESKADSEIEENKLNEMAKKTLLCLVQLQGRLDEEKSNQIREMLTKNLSDVIMQDN